MTDQPDLFQARAERDAAIQAARDAANANWRAIAEAIVRELARRNGDPPFSTDDVWAALATLPGVETSEPRALGAVMQQAARAGIIEKIPGMYIQSTRRVAHCRPIPVWRRVPGA